MLFKRILRNTKKSPILQEDISAHFSLVSRETQPSPSSTTLPQHNSGWRQRSGPSPPSHSSRTWAAPSVSSSGSPSCRSGTVLTLCWDIKMSEVKYIDCYYFNFQVYSYLDLQGLNKAPTSTDGYVHLQPVISLKLQIH